MEYGLIFIALACIVGLWMTWGIGANDLANIMSTAMGSRAISVKQAMLIAIVFEIAGAFLGGNEVSDTIRGGIIDMHSFETHYLVYAMLSVLLAGATWITVASILGMPVSITNSIVGALVGVGAIMLGVDAVHWEKVGFIAISWVSSPLIAGVTAFLLFISIRRWILAAENPFVAAKYLVPCYLLVVGIVLAFMTTVKGLHHFHVILTGWQTFAAILATVVVVVIVGLVAMRQLRMRTNFSRHTQFIYIEGMFSVLMAFTACAMVFAHGSNDVAIAVGPVAGVLSLVNSGNSMHDGWLLSGIMLAGCVGVILGLMMYGRTVI
jgi:PiT family inorganic phosphate transporter